MACNLKQAQTCNKREFYNVVELLDPEGLHRGHLAAVQKEVCFTVWDNNHVRHYAQCEIEYS